MDTRLDGTHRVMQRRRRRRQVPSPFNAASVRFRAHNNGQKPPRFIIPSPDVKKKKIPPVRSGSLQGGASCLRFGFWMFYCHEVNKGHPTRSLGEWINEFERQSLDRRNPSFLEPQLVKNVLAARDSPCINPLTYRLGLIDLDLCCSTTVFSTLPGLETSRSG